MLKASYIKHPMQFILPAGTSRGTLKEKDSWFIILSNSEQANKYGIGECSLIPGLSIDNPTLIEQKIQVLIAELNAGHALSDLFFDDFPALRFAYETAVIDLQAEQERILFPTVFSSGERGLSINGLIWMGSPASMMEQVSAKVDAGFKILKLKVGAIDFDDEVRILSMIRSSYSKVDLEIRLDANGAWEADEAIEKLNRLAEFHIHSLEQPIKAGNYYKMAKVCSVSPISIALDEELIGVKGEKQKKTMLNIIKPQYIIIKPSLLGGFKESEEWISFARAAKIPWWITSALESNIGLNAIAQWTATKHTSMAQGLGTGQLFSNNIPSPLKIIKDKLWYKTEEGWDVSKLIKD